MIQIDFRFAQLALLHLMRKSNVGMPQKVNCRQTV
jgi:hypothetical protein